MKSLKTKFSAVIGAAAMVVAGLAPIPAQASGSPYTVTAVKSDLTNSSDLVAGTNRVYWKNGNQLWTSDGTTTSSIHTFTSATSFSLNQSSPQYTEGGFWDYNTYINRSVFVGDTVYFWAADTDPNSPSDEHWNVWKSDGTIAGTVRVTNRYLNFQINSGIDAPTSLKKIGNYIYFWDHLRDFFGNVTRNLNRINITTGASEIVTGAPTSKPCMGQSDSAVQNQFELIGSNLIFDYGDYNNGTECINRIGSLNLTSYSFSSISPINVGNTFFSSQGPQNFTRLGDKVYFIAALYNMGDGNNSELWVTDGTSAGTTQVTTLATQSETYGVQNPKTAFMRPFVYANNLYFMGYDALNYAYGIYKTDGASAPTLWLSASQISSPGTRTNVSPQVVVTNSIPYLIIDAKNANGKSQQYSVNMNTKVITWLTPSFPATEDTIGVVSQAWAATDYTTPISWDNKVWWSAITNADNPGAGRNLYYTDGSVSGTSAATTWESDNGQGIGYQGSGQVDQFADNATRPLVATTNALWFLRGPSASNSTNWTLYKVTANPVTPPTPALTCSNQMTKLKVEAESASDLKQGSTNTTGFSGSVCEYNMSVDNKTSKVDFAPTFTGSLAMKVGGTSVASGSLPKSTKTYSATLGAAGTSTSIDFIFGANTYRVNVERKAAPAPGARDGQFSAPSLNGAVVTTDKDTKKEINQNGDKKETEVTYIGGSFTGKVAKVDEKGEKDEEFSTKVPAIGGTVTTVKVDEQHRVLVGGQNVDGDKDVVRLKPDGSKDNSFSGPDLGVGKKVDDIEVQKDGKIVIVGDFGDNKNAKKLKDDGSEDESFKNNLPTLGGSDKEIKTVKIQEDGKILLGGKFDDADGDSDKDKVIRVEKDGHIDGGFEPATNSNDPSKKAHFNDDVEDIEVQKDGKIVVVGKSEKSSDDEADKVVRLNKDGKEDSTFVFDGNIPSGKKVEAVKVKDSGEIYIAGDFDNVGDNDGDKIAKVKKDGHVDTDWNPPTQGGDVHDIELEKHGKVFLGGEGSGDGDRVDKVHEDGDRDGDKPRYDSIDDDRASNKVDTGTKGQTKIHGDGFKDGTTVTIGGQTAKVIKIDDRDEEITIQVPAPDNNHKGDGTHERKGADIVISVPDGHGGHDDIEIKDGFGYTDVKEAQRIEPDNDHHINSDKDDSDGKGKVHDDEQLAAHIPSDDPITHVSKTPDVCTVDDENRVHYHHRGDCKIVTDAPGDMGHVDPAPVTEVIPVAGLDPELVAPTLPALDPQTPSLPDSGFQLPDPGLAEPTIPVVYTPTTPEACDVTADGVVTPIDTSADCTIKITTPGDPIYEPTAPSDPPVTVTIPHTAWIPPVPQNGVITDPDVPSVAIPGTGGTVKLGNDLGFKYDKAKGTLTPTAWGIYFGPIKATITYSWTNTNPSTQVVTTGSGTCVVNWGVLKKWTSLSKADQKKYKKPLAAKVFTTTANCKVNPAAKAALAKPGTSFTASSDVLRTRMWPATYKPEKPIIPNVRPNPVPIEPRLRHYTLTISTQ